MSQEEPALTLNEVVCGRCGSPLLRPDVRIDKMTDPVLAECGQRFCYWEGVVRFATVAELPAEEIPWNE